MTFSYIPEAFYSIFISAPNHTEFSEMVFCYPGVTTNISAFLSRNLITYTWVVTPTTIPDVYTFVLEAVFETTVPLPVLTIDPAALDISKLKCSPNTLVNFSIPLHEFDLRPRYHEPRTNSRGQRGTGFPVSSLFDFHTTHACSY